MAKLTICAINKISSSSWENKVISNYLKRIPWKIDIHQLELKNKLPADKQKALEGELLLNSRPNNTFIISLDERGKQFSSHEFTEIITAKPTSLIIGGAYGLSEEVRNKSNLILSLSKLTMPHTLARVVLIEQIYRAYTINSGHPYHK